ncbi:MAG: filamentous hemagglutinin N-terminal domain-containing protein, partial [Gammaproteobacteria bacterium]|nr:filamentous hemagglutinin N-terminal domain-containing protein [Gammaproteobacteria bacterium]
MKVFFTKQCFQRRKSDLFDVACGLFFSAVFTSFSVVAAPQGGAIVAGQGSISAPSSSVTQIQQFSNNMVVDWQSFNVGANELVQFSQPSSTAAVLNRINDISPSEIFGSVTANGLLFLMNPNGILFGEGSRVQVNGLFATNLEMDASRFMSGDYAFESLGMLDGSIINRGVISASTGGVSLISDTGVVNDGKILATVGSINLAVTTSATLDFSGDGLLQLVVTGEVLNNAESLDSAISNSGEIIAEGGDVLISGRAARDVFTNVVNNTGVIRATRVINEGGVITLAGSSGNINNSGTLDVSGAEAGEIVVTAENISHSGLIDASTTSGNAGSVTLQSSADTFVQAQSLITAQADNGTGGNIQLLGNRVGVFDSSQVNASGTIGGGNILIGGDYQGNNSDIQNASQTYVGAGSSIAADAAESGNGGKVIVWADQTTQYYGSISAQGGAVSGDGGFVEVSGKSWLNFAGLVNTGAVNGITGALLLDPTDITIQAAGATDVESTTAAGTETFQETTTTDTSILTVADLLTALGSNNVVVTADSTGAGGGDITVADAINTTADLGADRSLTLDGRNIYINAGIDATTGSNTRVLTLNLNADAINGGGTVEVNAAITTNNGNLTVSSVGDVKIGGLVSAGTADVSITTSDAGSDVYSVAATDLLAARRVTINSAGSIGQTAALYVDVNAGAANRLQLASCATCDITVVENTALNLNALLIADTVGVRNIDLTASSWSFNNSLDLGDDNIFIRAATGGDINGSGTATDILTAAAITLESLGTASTDDIGNANTVLVSTSDLTVIAVGDAKVTNDVEFTDLTLVLDPSTKNDNAYAIGAGGNQTVTIADANNIGIQFAFADTSTSDVNITIHNTSGTAAQGDIEIRDGDINAGAGVVSLISDSQDIIQQSSGSVITAGSLQLSAARHITVDSVVSSIAAVSSGAGDIDIGNTGTLDITTIGPDALGNSFTGVSTVDGTITIASTGTITVSEDISDAGNNDITITSSAGDIEGVAGVNGTISTGNVAATVILNANGGIGLTNAVKTSSTILDLTTGAANTAGNIAINNAIALNISDVAISTSGANHVFDIGASSITVDTNTDEGNNTVILRATAGNIDDGSVGIGGNTLTATILGFEAAGTIDVSTIAANIAASADGTILIESTHTGTDLTVGGVSGFTGISTVTDQDITLTSADAGIDITEAINAGVGSVNLTTTDTGSANYDIGGIGLVTAGGGLTVIADGGISLTTDLQSTGSLSLTTAGNDAAGNITVVDAGDIISSNVTVTTNGTNAATRTVDLTARSWEIDGAFAVAGTTTDIDLNLTATETAADPTTKPHGIFNAGG